MATRCMGCMRMKSNSPVCEHCGFDENQKNNAHQLPVGTVVGEQYLLGQVLGQGGFGITYIGWDNVLQQRVAVKEFFPTGYAGRDTNTHRVSSYDSHGNHDFENNKQRFLREAESLAKLWDIPHIVRVLRHFEDNGTAYIAMEYVEGMDLRKYMKQLGRPMGMEELLDTLGPVMEALSHVHKADLVHRDISPDNIMVLPDGSTKLLDFGAARYVENASAEQDRNTSTQAILKHGFAPPEQYRSHGALGPWTDVYAMCATVYYCLTGKKPEEAMNRMIEDAPVGWNAVPGLTRHQRNVLEAGMALKPRNRIKSVDELYQSLFGELLAERERARQEAEEEKRRLEEQQRKEQAQKEAEARRAEEERQREQARLEAQQWLAEEKRRKEAERQEAAQKRETERKEARQRKQATAEKKEQERKAASEKRAQDRIETARKKEKSRQETRQRRQEALAKKQQTAKEKQANLQKPARWIPAAVCAVLAVAAMLLIPKAPVGVPEETQAAVSVQQAVTPNETPTTALKLQENLVLDQVEPGYSEAVPVVSGHDPAALTWTTSDPQVAEVSANGELTVRSHGTVEITAQWKNQTASCVVEIYRKPNVTCEYVENETGITITGISNYPTEIVFPGAIDGKPVTAIDDILVHSKVTSIIIPEGVTRIEEHTFGSMENLSTVSLPSTITCIGDYAFSDCDKLKQITIPDSVTYIGQYAFYGAPWLEKHPEDFVICGDGILVKYNGNDEHVTIPNDVKQISSAFAESQTLLNVTIPGSVTMIGDSAFEGCRNLISVTIPDSVASIGEKAFYECSALVNISIPETVISIGSLALHSTPWMENQEGDFVIHNGILMRYKGTASHVTIPNGVKTISGAFWGQYTVESVVIPSGVVSIGGRSFLGCNKLTNVTIADTVTSIDEFAFYRCSNLRNLIIPDGVTFIGDSAFGMCSGITSLTIPESVSFIGEDAFLSCTGLTSINIPGSVDVICDGTFYGCHSLKEVILEQGISAIGSNAFFQCSSLTSVTIPEGVSAIGFTAFCYCDGLLGVTIPGSVTSIDDRAFDNTALRVVSVSSGCNVAPDAFPENCTVNYY